MADSGARRLLIVGLLFTLVGGASVLCLIPELCAPPKTVTVETASGCHESSDHGPGVGSLEMTSGHADCCGQLREPVEAKIERRPGKLRFPALPVAEVTASRLAKVGPGVRAATHAAPERPPSAALPVVMLL